MANVELDPELNRLGVARTAALADAAAAAALGAKTPTGTSTSVQAALDALKGALDNATAEQLQALQDLTTSVGQSNNAINQAIAQIQQQLEEGGGSAIKEYIKSSTISAGSSVVLTVGQTTKSMLLYKLATGITQATVKNLDVTLTVGGSVVYSAESAAKSIDSIYPIFTDHTGDIILTLANKSADSCDVSTKALWSEL